MKNTGKQSEAIFISTLEEAHGKKCFIYRLVDTTEVKRVAGGAFVKAGPADFIVTIEGSTFFAEIKSVLLGKSSFSFSNFTTAQRIAMVRQTASGGDYFVFINRIDTADWFKIPARVILSVWEARSSMKWTEMEGYKWVI